MDENSVQKTEISPKEIFKLMKINVFDNFTHFSLFSINKDYINSRKALFNLLHKITIKMGFKSQTFFLCAHYLDIIFTKKKRINLNLNLLGLSCLCLASKFCENDPIVPHLQYFLKIFNNINGYKNAILMSELKKGEVYVLKILNYKLNYYTIYDFNSFLFGHGILKIEQLKDIENKNKKLYRSSRKKFVVNSTNSLMIKNILEKVYKKSRDYLDIIIKNTRICFKYNPLFISIYIMKKSVEETLANERKINSCDKKEKNEFYEKNNQCFRQIMYEFYKINYEDNEQYKRILEDEEINEVFETKENKEKNEGNEAAPSADNRININNNENNNNINQNRNLFINTYSGGFYKRMKLGENNINEFNQRNNNNINNRRNIVKNNSSNSNSKSNDEESKEEDDLNLNLNINEIQKAKEKKLNSKKDKTSYNFYKTIDTNRENKNNIVENRYVITTNNRETNTITKKNNISNNYDLTYSVEPSRNKFYINNNNNAQKNSPVNYGLNNTNSNTGIKKYVKIKGINTALDIERNNYLYKINNNPDNNHSNSSTNINANYNYNTIKKFEKQPYFKKLINNDSINSIKRKNISSMYLTNSDLNKNKEDTNFRNTVNATISTFNRIKVNSLHNKNNVSTDINMNDLNDKESQIISTTTARFRKTFYRNRQGKNTNINDISTEVKNANDLIIQDNNDSNKKKEIESYSQFSWKINSNNNNNNDNKNNSFLNKLRNNDIFVRKIKIPSINNNLNNNDDKKNLTSRNFFKTNLNLNNNNKRININISNNNKIINNSCEYKDYINNKTNINNEPEKKILVNTIENNNSQRVYQSIRHKYLNMKKNRLNNNEPKLNNNNDDLNDQNSKTATYFYKKNTNNNSVNQIQNNSVRENYEPQIDSKSKYKKFAEYSIYTLFHKTKELLFKNNNSKEDIKRINDKKNSEIKNSIPNSNNNSMFYKSQQNFYQPKSNAEININNNNRKIVINNNININIGNKTNNINNDYNKYKNIYRKNTVQTQTNSKKSGINNDNINENINSKSSNNNNKVNRGINFGNILNKFQFYRKNINKK